MASGLVLDALSPAGEKLKSFLLSQDGFSPRFDRDLSDLLSPSSSALKVGLDGDLESCLAELTGETKLLVLSGDGGIAAQASRSLEPARVISLAGQRFCREDRDELRNRQRLLPAFEVEFSVAVKTAMVENEGIPFIVYLHLSSFERALLPEVPGTGMAGLSWADYLEGLAALKTHSVMGLQLGGLPSDEGLARVLPVLSELLRDTILSIW